MEFILSARGLVKQFNGFTAVNGIDLDVRPGTIHALIGPNGAGKTTCFNLLTKFLEPTAGSIYFRGIDITKESAAHVARRGIVRSFQISAVFPHLSVLENIVVALQSKNGGSFQFWRSDKVLSSLTGRVRELLRQVDLEQFSHEMATSLPYGRKRALEIATTLAMEPELMLLDEPTQGMGAEDVDRIRLLIRQANANCAILMVEHNMNVVASIADRITVLARGSKLAEGTYNEVSRDPSVIEAYMGSSSVTLERVH